MRNTFGNNVTVTLFGESHGEAIGAVLDGIPSGKRIDRVFIAECLKKRKSADGISTARSEDDAFKIISGLKGEYTTGTPICIVIENTDVKPEDYSGFSLKPRPSHADWTAYCKYGEKGVLSGGGHFSGRLTAPLVAAGAIALSLLEEKGISIGTHIKKIADISDRDFDDYKQDISRLNGMNFAVLDDGISEKMREKILAVKAEGDSVGGILETAVIGLPAGVGEPWFDTLEGMISHAIFSIPAVKGIEFGAGFAITEKTGSSANDEFCIKNGKIGTSSNNSGGISGGISNGEPIIFRTAVKPTPTIFKEQRTVDIKSNTETVLIPKGRHDPCIVHRARIVADSLTALVILDMLYQHFGFEGLK